MNKQELIDGIISLSYENYKYNPYVERKRVLELVSQLNEPQSIKLKDVIARIKQLDLGTQEVWLNEILNELSSDYGSLKYSAGYEQGRFDCAMEREKVIVPQFVADWIEECKNDDFHLFGAMEEMSLHQKKMDYWFREDDNMELFARAWLDGYEVEKEKRYYIRLKNVDENYNYLNYIKHLAAWCLTEIKTDKKFRTTHTRKELEEAGFSEVFNSPLFEVEEVEE